MHGTRLVVRILAVAGLLAGFTGGVAGQGSDPLERGFKDPPDSAKPRAWWHWMNGNITKQGITADLEWMKRVGIGGMQMFDGNLGTPVFVDKRLVWMTPEWKDAFRHAAAEADRLGLEMAMAASGGWSETGGPWVKPEGAMKKVVWSETLVEGPKSFTGKLASPPSVNGTFQDMPTPPPFDFPPSPPPRGAKPEPKLKPAPPDPTFYADSAVLAYRLPEGEVRMADRHPKVTASGGTIDAATLLDGDLNKQAAVSIAEARFRSTGFALYFDDVWRLTSKLTLNYGLRYEMTPPWEDQTGKLFNGIVPHDAHLTLSSANVTDPSLFPYFMRQGASRQNCYEGVSLRWPDIQVRCDGTLGNRLVGIDKNDFAPRLGLSWSPTPKWVVRAGAGMFYSQDSGNPRFDMARNLAGRLRDNSKTDFPHLNWGNALASIAGGVANVFRPYTFANPYDRRTPYATQFMANVQRELPQNILVEAGYLGSVSHRLESLRAVNEALPADPAVDSRSVPNRSPFPTFGRIQLVDNGGNGNYHSLGLKFTKRYSNGLTYLAGYTWAKSLDTATAIRNQGGDTLFPQNSYCRSCERARSSHDVRHRFVTSAVWELPFGRGRRYSVENPVGNAMAGGWQMSATLTLQSGFPVTMTNGNDNSNTGAFFDRPDATGQEPALPRGQQDPRRFFNTGAFKPSARGTFGNVGRNTLDSPGIIGQDFAMHKNFYLASEQRTLQLRFEWFNFPNHPNWNNPNTNVVSGSFGQITNTRNNMRQLQLGMKLSF